MSRQPGLLSAHQILSLYLPAMVLALGSSMVAPVIPGFARSFDVDLSTASLVFVAFTAGATAATFPAGYLIDKIGRRPVLLAGPVIGAFASLMTPFAGSFVQLLLWRFIVGGADQLWQQARLAMITDTARDRERARQVQWMLGVARGGQLFGPAIGGLLAASLGTWMPFALHASLLLLVLIPSFKLMAETAPERRQGASAPAAADGRQYGWRAVIAYLLTFQMVVFLFVQLMAQLARGGQEYGSLNLYAVYAYNVDTRTLGLLSSAAVVFGLPVPFLTGYIMDRYGRRAIVVPGFASYGIATVLMSLTGFLHAPFEYFLAAYILVQATQGTTGGTMQVLGTDLAPPFARGRFFAIWRMIAQLGATLSPGLFGLIAEHVSYGAGFVYLGICAFLVAVCVGTILGNTMARADAEAAKG